MKRPLWPVAVVVGLPLYVDSLVHAEVNTLPAEGSANYATYYTTHQLSHHTMDGIGEQWVQEMVGITRNTDGEFAFDNMAVRCVGYVQQVHEEWYWTGACTETDMDGDQVFTTFDMESHRLVGGTGKYEGISGSAPYTSDAAPRISPTQNAAVVHHAVTWKLE